MIELLTRGGPVILILVVLSVIALTIIIAKWVQFSWLRINAEDPVYEGIRLWREGDVRQALDRVNKKKRRPVNRVVHAAMWGLAQRHREDLVREEVTRIAKEQIEGLRGWLRPLDVIATVSPLLGLFGTVLGMIEAFQRLEQAGNSVDPAILSGGIWQALLTTAVGLAVAIPAMLAHSWLDRSVDSAAHTMEDSATRVFTAQAQAANSVSLQPDQNQKASRVSR